MNAPFRTGLVVALLGLAQSAAAQSVAWAPLNLDRYHSFVMNWTPPGVPLCAVLSSSTDWNRVVHAAPTMFSRGPYAPPDAFWKDHAVVLVARVVDQAPNDAVIGMTGVTRSVTGMTVRYRFTPPPKASSQMKAWALASVVKPLSGPIRFLENGREVCDLRPERGTTISPPPLAP